MGLFVTLTAPTKPMVTEAISAGFYESPHFPGGYPSNPEGKEGIHYLAPL